MYTYKFVKIELSAFGNPKEDYHTIIEKEAKEGWRLVQVFSPSTGSVGSSAYFELIFEKAQA